MSSTKPTSTDGQEKAARNGHDPRKRDYSQEVPTTPEKARVTYRIWRTVLVSLLCAVGAGLTASLVAVVVMGILRLWAGIPTPVELFGDFVLKHIDVHTFIHLLQTYAPNPKTTPLGLALLGMIGAGVALSFVYAALVGLKLPLGERQIHPYRPQRREWLVVTGLMVGMTLVAVILFWNEIRQNFLGLPVGWASLVTAI